MPAQPPQAVEENADPTPQQEGGQNFVAAFQNAGYMLHSFKVFGSRFIITTQYKPLKGLGRGAYGICISALDTKDPCPETQKVAIKKIPKMFQDLVDAKRILREVKLLKHFKHPNIINLRDLVPSYGDFEELFLVLDFMETDLHKIIYSNNTITLDHVRFILYQMLAGLKYMHDCDVIHRDLKPSNILINNDTSLKICDFGLARGITSESDYLTEYVVTRWYRAPEVMASSDAYDYKIDLWSVGCILAELLNRNPLFAGNDYKQQLSLIFQTLGTPSDEDLAFVTNEYALSYIKSLPKRAAPASLSTVVRTEDRDCLDFLNKLLQFNPHKRITVDEALAHPFLSVYTQNCPNHVYVTPQQYKEAQSLGTEQGLVQKPLKWDDSFENEMQDHMLTKLMIQQSLILEIDEYHPDLAQLYKQRYFPARYLINPNGMVKEITSYPALQPTSLTTDDMASNKSTAYALPTNSGGASAVAEADAAIAVAHKQ